MVTLRCTRDCAAVRTLTARLRTCIQVAAATEAAQQCKCERPKLLAVTVLTSLDDADLSAVGQSTPAEAQVVRLALLAQSCGMDGVVCSAREIEPIRKACGPEFLLIVPGIRPAGTLQLHAITTRRARALTRGWLSRERDPDARWACHAKGASPIPDDYACATIPRRS